MSKSKGNVVEPQEVMEKFGGDALRYWAANSKLGEDLDYQEKDVITGKKFITKIYNATNFVFMNLKNYKNKTKGKSKKPVKMLETDRLFLSRLNETIKNATASFENYEYARAKSETDNFFWRIFCDNYLEIVKNRVYNGTREEKESAFFTLYNMLFAILKLFAPFTPFITEHLYQMHFKKNEKDKSIHLSEWPCVFKIKQGKNDDEILELLLKIISDVRQEKSKAQKSMKAEIVLYLDKAKMEKLKPLLQDLKSVTNALEIKEGNFKVEIL